MNLASSFFRAARLHPTRPALEVSDSSYTYEHLAQISRGLAQAILDHEVEPHHLVGVFASRSLTAYSAILAALTAGKGYLPLNPSIPVARTTKMLSLAGTRLLVVGSEAIGQLEALLSHCSEPLCVLLPDVDDATDLRSKFPQHTFIVSAHIDRTQAIDTASDVSASDIAYLLFTSGSTGEPKGVPISHDNVLSYVSFISSEYDFSSEDRCSQSFELTFDPSVHDMFVTWSVGACLCAVPARSVMAPAKFIRDKQLTVWYSVPSVAMFMSRMKMLKANALPCLRYSIFSGEPLMVHIAEAWQAAAPQSQIVNFYGPTEATINITHHTWGDTPLSRLSKNGVVAIGPVFQTQRECIIDEDRNLLSVGEVGELCLSGSQLTGGYLNSPEKTREQFITIPATGTDIWYRTGDLVEKDANECLYFLGRIDNQVKILGHRIELQEVDYAIQQCAGTEAAVTIAWPVEDHVAQGIVGFVFGDCPVAESEIIRRCSKRLPSYMVPSRICFQSAPPLNPNGKIDRTKLTEYLEEAASA